jgi:hypothetical protein
VSTKSEEKAVPDPEPIAKAKSAEADKAAEPKTKASAENKATMVRSKFVTQARAGVGKKDVSYEARQPINELASEKPVPLATDAAGYLIASAKWAGLDDPSGNEYSGEGTTGDLLKQLEQIPASEAEPGDLVVFGGGIGHHAAVLTEQRKGEWQVVGHGEDGPPVEQPLAEMAAGWPEPVTFLRLPV